jgi:hypothetical protein
VDTTEEILALCREVLSGTIGNEIECSWVAWHHSYDQWWDDAPVILRIDGVNYEFCWQKTSDFALTRDTIDVRREVKWTNSEDSLLFWKKDALPRLQAVVGKRIIGLQLQGHQVVTDIPSVRENYGDFMEPVGLNFLFEDGLLSIYNSLDSNGLATRQEE